MKTLLRNIVKLITVFSLFLGVFAISSCDDDNPVKSREKAVTELYKKHNKINIAVPNSFSVGGESFWNAILLAEKRIKEEKLCDAEIHIERLDDKAIPSEGMKVAYTICDDKTYAAVIGHGFSDISKPCSLIYQYYGILNISPVSTVADLTTTNNDYLFRNVPSDTLTGAKAAEFCMNQNYKNILIYYADLNYGNSLANSFELCGSRLGVNVVYRDSFDIRQGESEFKNDILRWKSNFLFDAIFLAGSSPQINSILKVLRENDVDVPVVGADSFELKVFIDDLTSAENGRLFSISSFNKHSDWPAFVKFWNDYEAEYGSEPDFDALQAYDALIIYAKAVKLAGTSSPAKVAAVLRENKWEDAAGPYNFDENGDVTNKDVVFKVYKDGDFVPVE